MDISIIIINYNQKNFLKVCFKGILKLMSKINYEIIIVDNASTDGSQEILTGFKIKDLRLKVILNNQNLGFGAGCNKGIKISHGEYILILNPDIAVLENSIDSLVKFMEENKKVGIVGPQLLNPDRTIQKSCFRYPCWHMPILRRTMLGKLPWAKEKLNDYLMSDFNHQSTKKVDWILGAALMLRKEMIKKIGLFDERFFLYFEDIDLCRRANKKGWDVVYCPDSKMFHYHQRDSARLGIFSIFSSFTRIHIVSAVKYFLKWRKA
ncbi:MAG: glycosyltransferase family 2 protein [Desulfobulbaceae bacterium]|nr:glycosyltransferase family 2 protein [Desulfobulbaceae bacterium]